MLEKLWSSFLAGERGVAFDALLTAEPALARDWAVDRLVHLYRTHVPQICFIPGIEALLNYLFSAKLRVGVVTDGPANAQRRKIDALGIRRWAEAVVITDDLPGRTPKPGHDGYKTLMERLSVTGNECVYVGDNPRKDFRGARELGWWTIRLRLPGQLHESREPESAEDAADVEVRSVEDLAATLKRRVQNRES